MDSVVAAALAYALLAGGCTRSPLVSGGLYSVVFDEHGYRIAKVLVVDEHAVHVRVYKQSFATRPETVDPTALTLGSIHDPDGFGIGHMPLSEADFQGMNPRLVQVGKVTDDELDGYRYWQESNGGVWGQPR